MRKTALVTISILIAFMFSSCSDSTEDLTEANTLAAFDVTEFASKGINEYFENPQITGEAEFSASFSSSRSVNDNGSATILASFRDYPYNDYTVTGDFIYTLPVESGRILGYRMETASGSSPTFKDKKDQETQFSITMDETALAPAGGDYNTVTNTVSNGIAMPMLEGTEATFTVGTSSISLDDIPKEEEPYNRSMIAEDLYSLMMANGPLSGYAIKLLKEQLPSTGMSGGTYTANLGNGNTYTITYDAENMSSHAELKIINPMDFIVTDSTGRSYSVHTNGKVSVTGGGSAEGKGSGEVEYKDFVSTIIVTGDTDPVTYTSRKINGSYSMDLSDPDIVNGSIRIGNHTYSGQSYKGLVSLYALDMTITQFWRFSVISEDGSYINTLGGTDASPIIVKGQYNEKEGTLSGEISVYGTDYPFTAKIKLTGTTGTFLSLSYNGIDFTDDDINYLNAIYELNYAFTSMIM